MVYELTMVGKKLVWFIWLEKNRRVFRGRDSSWEDVGAIFIMWVQSGYGWPMEASKIFSIKSLFSSYSHKRGGRPLYISIWQGKILKIKFFI